MSYIYKIQNLKNNKVYVGATTRHPSLRFREHYYDSFRFPHRPLYAAIQKYGISSFSYSIIEECEESMMQERERYWIEELRTFKNGYNATIGGDGKPFVDYDLVLETYRIIQNIDETADRLGVCRDTVQSILIEHGERIRSSWEIQSEKYGKMVNMFDMDGSYIKTFPTLRDAAKYLVEHGLTNCKLSTIRTHISHVCKGLRKSAAKRKWAYAN